MKCRGHFKSNGYRHGATNNFQVYTSLKEIGLEPEKKMSYIIVSKKILRAFGTRQHNIYLLLKHDVHEGKGLYVISEVKCYHFEHILFQKTSPQQ